VTIARIGRIKTGPLILFAAAAFVLADLAILLLIGPPDFGFDFTCCYQQAAARALDDPSTLYQWSDTYTFRYTPIGALFFLPLVPLSETAAVWAWLAFKVAVLAVCAWWFGRSWPADRRVLLALMVLAFPPAIHDLVLGNVSVLTLLVFLAVARWQDPRGGVAIGLLTVLMPKPHLLPVLAYLAIRRPRDFLASLATIVVGVAIGLVIFGIDPWLEFIASLREPLERTFTANVGFSALFGPIGVVIGVVVGVVVVVAGMLLGGSRGYGLSIIGGIAMGPYTFIHYLVGTLVAAEPVLRARPRWLVPFPWLLIAFPLIPLWLTGLAGVVRASPPPPAEEAAPQAAAPG
jgi:glycosyl transferase family 87